MPASISVLVFFLSTTFPCSNIHHPFLLFLHISCQATAKIPTIRRLSRLTPSPFLRMPFETSFPRPPRTQPQDKSRVSANTGPRPSPQAPESESTNDANNAAKSSNDPATPNTPSSLAAAAGSPDADASPITPAPLNVPPSRARRQFAARLAERKRAAAEHGTSDSAGGAAGEGDDEQQQFSESMGGEGDAERERERERERDWTERYGGDTGATEASTTAAGKAPSLSSAAGGALRFSNLFKHSAEDSDEEEEESSSDEEGEDLVMKEGVLARKRSGVGSSAGSTSSAGSGGGGSDKERE
ncbi:uncharacterized protein J3D65DRAFT_599359 [Phyllosticta citribraziliensis]|uniref:Uncharacterized protein n=1 Tax=Phyllosticta citribraziliensis TaxID=989973 RepID=A0ABR1MA21_9PEZI